MSVCGEGLGSARMVAAGAVDGLVGWTGGAGGRGTGPFPPRGGEPPRATAARGLRPLPPASRPPRAAPSPRPSRAKEKKLQKIKITMVYESMLLPHIFF